MLINKFNFFYSIQSGQYFLVYQQIYNNWNTCFYSGKNKIKT